MYILKCKYFIRGKVKRNDYKWSTKSQASESDIVWAWNKVKVKKKQIFINWNTIYRSKNNLDLEKSWYMVILMI